MKSRAPLIDSTFEHWRAWNSVCKHFKRGSDEEYFVVPRGRVLLRRQDGAGVIYHGDATSNAMLKRIAKLFELATYTTVVNGHYLMDAEEYFND